MRCYALTPERTRCTNEAQGESSFCAAHQDENAQRARSTRTSKRGGGILARVRGAFRAQIPDGGKYDVLRVIHDAPTARVIELLRTDADPMVRWMTAFELRKRRAPEAIEPLWDALVSDNTRYVRQQCAVALGKIGSPPVFAPLVEGLNHDRDQGVRQACAVALGNLSLSEKFDHARVMDELVRVLEREENIFVKWDCIVALGQLGNPSFDAGPVAHAEKLLVRMQAEEIAQVVRDACGDSLSEIRQRALA